MSALPLNQSQSDNDMDIQVSPFNSGRRASHEDSKSPPHSAIAIMVEPERRQLFGVRGESVDGSPQFGKLRSYKGSSSVSYNTCIVCASSSTKKNTVAVLNCITDALTKFRELVFIDEKDKVEIKLVEQSFQRAHSGQMVEEDEDVQMACCYKCRSQLGNAILSSVRRAKLREKSMKYIMQRYKSNLTVSPPLRNACYLASYNHCSAVSSAFSRPLIPRRYPTWVREPRAKEFASFKKADKILF